MPHALRDVPLHLVLWDYLAVLEDDRMEALRRDRDALHLAGLVNLALCATEPGKALAAEDARLQARARALLSGVRETAPDAETMQAKARAMIERILRSGAMADLTPPAGPVS